MLLSGRQHCFYGNPWIRGMDAKGNPIWRGDDECYIFSHEKPPNAKFPFTCSCCNKSFRNQADVDADKVEISKFSNGKRLDWQRQHFGNLAHQAPIFNIPPSRYLPPLYHYTENLFQWRFKHLIWDMCPNDNVKYELNVILKEKIGYCHLPPKKGDPVFMMSFIGHDICNLRANAEVMAQLIKKVYPSDFVRSKKKTPTNSPNASPAKKRAPEVEVPDVSQYDNLYSDDNESEKSAEEQMDAAMQAADHLHADSLSAAQKVAEAFDTCWDATDELIVDDDWIDDEEGRKKKKAKLSEVGKRANEAAVRALPKAVYSEYQAV